ncbi:glutamine amidotransferase [Microbacterium sp. CGR1]|uniref:glutamine amidotransferase n=1 Tax=Microbacterium sp. CGR1 TaxID=1696072 RepID=UPI003DA6722D
MSDESHPRILLALRHVQFEDLGILEPALVARGYSIRYLDAGIDGIDPEAVDAADVVVVLGGPIGVHDEDCYPLLRETKVAVDRRLRSGRPMLGICLGAQLIAEAMGAAVRSTGAVEIGYAPLDLTPQGLTSPLRHLDGVPVLHWHGDEFGIPVGAAHLASTPGFPHQAFSAPNVLGLQFHLEPDSESIERWLIGHAHELSQHDVDPNVIRADARRHGAELRRAAAVVLDAWLDDWEHPSTR